MKKLLLILFAIALITIVAVNVQAAQIDLMDWGFNIDGNKWSSDPSYGNVPGNLPGYVNTSGFNFATGLGKLSITLTGSGSHSIIGFFDHEIDQTLNTFFNESGSVSGVAAAGQSWEIDEPGWTFGNIFTNFENGALDNSNSVPAGLEDDVSMAMGWNFILNAGETAFIDFILSDTTPGTGFNVIQWDPDSNQFIYFSGPMSIKPGPNPIPEPGTLMLLGSGLIGLLGFRKRFLK